MSRSSRLYYYTILGALGGVIGGRLIDMVGYLNQPSVYLSDLVLGATLGLSVGFMIGATEGFISRSLIRGLRAGLISGLIGLLAGAIALPLGELVFLTVGGGLFGRILGWAIFGSIIGLAHSLTGGTQVWKGALGGFIGGSVGGLLLEAAFRRFENPLMGKVAGLLMIGAAVGAFTALILVTLSRAWIEVKTGKLKGTEFILDKFIGENSPAAIIGSNVLKSDIALPDPDVAPQHARLKGAGTHFTLQDMSLKMGTFVNGQKTEIQRLSDNHVIKLGSTELVYHERR